MIWYAIKTSVFNYLWCLLTLLRMICPIVTRYVFYIFSTQNLFFGGLIIKVKICVRSFILYYQILFIYWPGIYYLVQCNEMVHLVISLPLKSVLIYYGIAFNALCDQAMTEMKYSSWKTELICDFIKTTCRLCKCVQ